MMAWLLFRFMGVLVLSLTATSLHSQQQKELSVGDTVSFNKIRNVINYSKPEISLSNYNGKVIVIDFWGTYCAPCIATLFKMDSLQKKYKDQIQFITVTRFDSKEQVFTTLNRFSKTRRMTLPVVVSDKQLSAYFPYKLVSHVVWIDKNRVVKAITGGDYVTEENVKAIIASKKIDWPLKKDVVGFDKNKPFVQFAQKDVINPRFLYSSSFTSSLSHLSPPNGRVEDTANKTATISFYNQTLSAFAQMAIDFKMGAKRSDFILSVKDSSRYFKPENEYADRWREQNTYCYSITLPISFGWKDAQPIIQEDVKRWLGVLGITVNKEGDRYIITEK